MAKDINLQDVFLNQARKEKIPVTIFITNGFQFKGIVEALTIILLFWTRTESRILYISMLSVPSRPSRVSRF